MKPTLIKIASGDKRLIVVRPNGSTEILDFDSHEACFARLREFKASWPKFLIRDVITGYEYWSK
jgi:hypothetical protein